MRLPEPRPPRAEAVHSKVVRNGLSRPVIVWRGTAWRVIDVDSDADAGADAATAGYQAANPRRHVSLSVLLRLTAMDVCCGPPSRVPAFLTA
jgi:hypothetical protein